jgi:hypothetical protein
LILVSFQGYLGPEGHNQPFLAKKGIDESKLQFIFISNNLVSTSDFDNLRLEGYSTKTIEKD